MAEGWGRHLWGRKYQFYSAGTRSHGMSLRAVEVMKEAGVDISSHQSKTTSELPDVKMDYVFTVCSEANENCPFFPGGKVVHVGFDDPPRLTKGMVDQEEILSVYRRVRDEIKIMVENIEDLMEGNL